MIFEGTLDKSGTVTIDDGNAVITDENSDFRVAAPATAGSNLLPITATDAHAGLWCLCPHAQIGVSA